MQEEISIKIKKLSNNAVIPTYAHEGDAGMDLTAIDVEYDERHDSFIYHTGLAFEVPAGYVMKLYPRSSIYKTNCFMTNHVGIVDSGYRGEVMLIFKNRNFVAINPLAYKKYDNTKLYMINEKAPYKVGERIGQLVIEKSIKVVLNQVEELSDSERGTGGHGSTGV